MVFIKLKDYPLLTPNSSLLTLTKNLSERQRVLPPTSYLLPPTYLKKHYKDEPATWGFVPGG